MEVKYDPKLVTALERGRVKRDWRAIAKRIEALEGQWQLVDRLPYATQAAVRERREEIYDRLRGVGCVTQVVALQGMNINQRPWSGWAVFARIPRARRTPTGKLI